MDIITEEKLKAKLLAYTKEGWQKFHLVEKRAHENVQFLSKENIIPGLEVGAEGWLVKIKGKWGFVTDPGWRMGNDENDQH